MTEEICIGIVAFVSWVLFVTEEIGHIIEEPFGTGRVEVCVRVCVCGWVCGWVGVGVYILCVCVRACLCACA